MSEHEWPSHDGSIRPIHLPPLSEDVRVIALVKTNGERYVFFWIAENRAEVLRTLGRFAVNPELSFSWYDAALLSQKIRNETEADL